MRAASTIHFAHKTTTDESCGRRTQSPSRAQALPPENALFLNLLQFSIIKRPKILRGQITLG